MKKRIFSIHDPMICCSYEAESRIYQSFIGKSGRRWVVAIDKEPANYIYIEGGKNSKGFGGRTLEFKLQNGEIIRLQGPWHSNADALYKDTGYDIRDKYFTIGIIGLHRQRNGYQELYWDILHEDQKPILGEYDRIEKLAVEFANKLQKTIYYSYKSNGGGISSSISLNNHHEK